MNLAVALHGQSMHTVDVPRMRSGKYTGNESVNLPVAHGMGVTPDLLDIWTVIAANGQMATITKEYPTILVGIGSINSAYTVTAIDATNFYVGAASSYPGSVCDSLDYMFVAWVWS